MQTSPYDDVFHMTIGASPVNSVRGISLENELRLLKAALLYADRVKFCSVSSSMLVSIMQLANLSGEDILKVFAPYFGEVELVKFFEIYKALEKKKRRSRQEIIAYKKMKSQFSKLRNDTIEKVHQLAQTTGIQHLEAALASGVVELQIFDASDIDELTQQYFGTVSQAILSGETYPIFDDATGKLVNAAVREGVITPSNSRANRAKHAGLSSEFLRRLPLFDDARIDEILDIRKELDTALAGFRAAVIRFSREVENAAWDEDFPLDAERVFLEHVKPTIIEIEEQCKSNKLLLSLLPNMISKPVTTAVGSTLGLLIAHATELPEMCALGLGVTAGTATETLNTFREWKQEKSQIESNQLYFYYAAGQSLKS